MTETVEHLLRNTHTLGKVKETISKLVKRTELANALFSELLRWRVVRSHNFSRLGRCSFAKREIEINISLFDPSESEQLIETLLHECAHFITICLHDSYGHDKHWKSVMSMLGAHAVASKPSLAIEERRQEQAKWIYRCCDCGYTFHALRRLDNISGRVHGPCTYKQYGGKITEIQLR